MRAQAFGVTCNQASCGWAVGWYEDARLCRHWRVFETLRQASEFAHRLLGGGAL